SGPMREQPLTSATPASRVTRRSAAPVPCREACAAVLRSCIGILRQETKPHALRQVDLDHLELPGAASEGVALVQVLMLGGVLPGHILGIGEDPGSPPR